jgi:hypothetical protein
MSQQFIQAGNDYSQTYNPTDTITGESGPGYAPGYPATHDLPLAQKGMISQPGTLDLSQRQMIDHDPENNTNPDPRGYGSEYSARSRLNADEAKRLGANEGDWMVYPTIYNGRWHAPPPGEGRSDEAWQHALATGQHMGIISGKANNDDINEYENHLHGRDIYVRGVKLTGDTWEQNKRRCGGRR